MNANKKGYLAPECEEIEVRLEFGVLSIEAPAREKDEEDW